MIYSIREKLTEPRKSSSPFRTSWNINQAKKKKKNKIKNKREKYWKSIRSDSTTPIIRHFPWSGCVLRSRRAREEEEEEEEDAYE